MTVAELRALTREAAPASVEPPRPLLRALSPAEPFPVDVLGNVLGEAARALNDRVQAPLAICGQSVLAAACLSVQGRGDVQLPTGQSRPISLFLMTVAKTGERKSACDHEALSPVRKFEQKLREQHAADLPSWENDHAAWKSQHDQISAIRSVTVRTKQSDLSLTSWVRPRLRP